jgi:hypothetical protein
MNFLTHNLLQSLSEILIFRSQIFKPQILGSEIASYSSDFADFFDPPFDAVLVPAFAPDSFFSVAAVAFFSAAASPFGATRFALGAATAPPRLRPLLSASLAGFASASDPARPFTPRSGRASFDSCIVT